MTIKILHDRGKQFLEIARTDHWHANIVLQLAESAGDSIDSLPAYIDRLLAIAEGCPGAARTERARYLGWLVELADLERAA